MPGRNGCRSVRTGVRWIERLPAGNAQQGAVPVAVSCGDALSALPRFVGISNCVSFYQNND